ncbi:putative CbiA domain-containing protein [Candidatus Hydrogenisulfobacillus filiaventi]|uniref:Putative CbiA domain-containing protein n=1 Tax=Candidatus Hydrogenisulfobacillus filiaventi TaxID=2707344 RepID=A0A6F8ZHN2_9FIRM|nr:putative CbiA domain-containing protein [Candidatus Hydrogenisulfobacillus filiaventi]
MTTVYLVMPPDEADGLRTVLREAWPDSEMRTMASVEELARGWWDLPEDARLVVSTTDPAWGAWSDRLATLLRARPSVRAAVLLMPGSVPPVDEATWRVVEVEEGDDGLIVDPGAFLVAWGDQEPVQPEAIPVQPEAIPVQPEAPTSTIPAGSAGDPTVPAHAQGQPEARRGLFGPGRRSRGPDRAPAPASGHQPGSAPPSPSVVREVVPAARFVAVIGAKGGVGVTTVTAHLLAAAARAGSALGVDLHYVNPGLADWWVAPGSPTLPDLGGVFAALEAAGEAGALAAEDVLARYVQSLPAVDRACTLVPAPRPSKRGYVLPPLDGPRQLLTVALRHDRWVLADLPPMLDEATEAAVRLVATDGAVVLVTTPEPDAVLAANRLWHQLTEGLALPPERIWLVVNRRGGPKEAIPAAEIARVHVPAALLGVVPYAPGPLAAAWQRHRPLATAEPWRRFWQILTGETPKGRRRA